MPGQQPLMATPPRLPVGGMQPPMGMQPGVPVQPPSLHQPQAMGQPPPQQSLLGIAPEQYSAQSQASVQSQVTV